MAVEFTRQAGDSDVSEALLSARTSAWRYSAATKAGQAGSTPLTAAFSPTTTTRRTLRRQRSKTITATNC